MNESDFANEMADLIESVKDGEIQDIMNNKDKFFELGELCSKSELFLENENGVRELLKDLDIQRSYVLMLQKIVNAPFDFMLNGIAFLYMPIISEKIKAGIDDT